MGPASGWARSSNIATLPLAARGDEPHIEATTLGPRPIPELFQGSIVTRFAEWIRGFQYYIIIENMRSADLHCQNLNFPSISLSCFREMSSMGWMICRLALIVVASSGVSLVHTKTLFP